MPKRSRKPSPPSVFRLRVVLDEVEPPVWRALLVPSDIPLGKLHLVLNEAMGWTNSHLHQFVLGKRSFGDVRIDEGKGLLDERKVRLEELLRVGDSVVYEYDFGDGWAHAVTVEERLAVDERLSYPLCVGGARACPPEDCGGPLGYEHLLEALADERHEGHDRLLTWVGGRFDAEGFDVNRTNRALWRLPR